MKPPGHPNEEQASRAQTYVQQVLAEEISEEPRRLVVVEGPDAGQSFPLDPFSPTRILLGTSVACGIRLGDPSVSRRHIALEPMGRRFRLTDLGSTNGTFVDGVSVVDAFVSGDELVRIGSSAFRIERTGEPATVGASSLPSAVRFGRVHGASVAMRRLYPLCEKLAAARIPVLIEGETGTGKELVAESIYEKSGAKGPFVVFDCTTVSPSLVEAELFGHERGAFTGAETARRGIFEEANGGTLLIDELGDLELPLQAKLLRVLDRGEIRRVGSNQPIPVDVRVLAATRRNLDRAIQLGEFRDDLFHRLAVGRVEVPPLRHRHGDISLLARLFARDFGITGEPPGGGGRPKVEPSRAPHLRELSSSTLARFEEYAWPGNVRELRNAIARYAALGAGSLELLGEEGVKIDPRHPPATAPGGPIPFGPFEALFELPFAVARRKAQDEFDREYVERTLRAHGGNVTLAARASGVALRYFRLVKARSQR